MSSEKAYSLEGQPDSRSNTWRTSEVRNTSAKVPIWGSPDGP